MKQIVGHFPLNNEDHNLKIYQSLRNEILITSKIPRLVDELGCYTLIKRELIPLKKFWTTDL